jgi:hypothetical protein
VLNLGDEPASLVFVNRFAPDLELGYPPLRFRIEPGEGVRLPAAGLFVAGCTLDKGEPDILLLVR